MARTVRYSHRELAAAQDLVISAKTLQQLRQGLAIIVPALTGASLATTAAILGVGYNEVCVLRRRFRRAGGTTFGERDRRGGRHHELMTAEAEEAFLVPWADKLLNGGNLVVSTLHSAYETKLGKQVSRSTIYRLLARHGWRHGKTVQSAEKQIFAVRSLEKKAAAVSTT